MGKRGTFAAAILCTLASAAAAQDKPVTTKADRPDTIKINVSGRALLDAVWRSKEVTSLTEGFTGGGATSDSENWIQGEVMFRLDAELSDKVSVVLEMGKRQTEDFGVLPTDLINDFDGGGAERVLVNEAHVLIQEFLMPALRAQLGISTWSFDVRGKGRSLVFDPRHSQTAARNFRRTEDTLLEWAGRADNPNELDPVGMTLTYSKDALTIDIVALPMVIEGGNPSEDEALYAFDLWYQLDSAGKGSRFGFIAALMNLGPFLPAGVSNGKTSVATIGGGIVINGLADGLEIYGEGYVQFGDAGKFTVAGNEEDVKAKGRAGQLGLEYRLPNNENLIWFGANVTYFSGDGDNDADDDGVDTFLGYENVRDLLILEDMYFGFDVDTNYMAFKIMAGLSLSVGQGKNNVDIAVTAAFCKTTEEVLLPSGEGEDKLGNEFDLRVTLHVHRQIAFRGALAWLSGSDLLEESMGGSTVSEAKDTGGLASLGVDVRF